MKVIIDITEEDFNNIEPFLNGQTIKGGFNLFKALEIIKNGTPLLSRGRWIDGHCSECGCDIPAYIIDWKWQKDMNAKYCPNCGVKMEVEE